jgi:hypothetical protein
VKRARQNLFPLRRLKRFGMGPQILKRFYSCTTESILMGCITAWYGNCSASDHKALQRVVRTAQYITGTKIPEIHDLYTRRNQRKALKSVKDSSHPIKAKGGYIEESQISNIFCLTLFFGYHMIPYVLFHSLMS